MLVEWPHGSCSQEDSHHLPHLVSQVVPEILVVDKMLVEDELYRFCGDQDPDLSQHNRGMQGPYSSDST